MMKSGDYDDQALLAELMLDAAEPLRWFDGAHHDREELAWRLEASLTPTLLFLGPDGTEVAPRIRGINTVEFFSFYVDRAIESAREGLGLR